MSEEEKKAFQDSKELINELNKNKDSDFIGRVYYKNKPIEDILQILLNLIEKQEKENTDLKELYIRTAKHQEKIGHVEFAEYMLAQIEAVPTFTTWEEYTTWVSKTKIRVLIQKLNNQIMEYNIKKAQGQETDIEYHEYIGIQIARDILIKLLEE